jgi:hypothetical protein
VTKIHIVYSDGTEETLERDKTPDFFLYIHSFGGVGIITHMTMTLEPSFKIFKSIYTDLPWVAL